MSSLRCLVLHGPNLNLLGTREPEIYGKTTLSEVDAQLVELGQDLGIAVECRQSNHEGQLVDWLQEAGEIDILLFNPAAYTHTSVAIRDALNNLDCLKYEVHISNVHKREPFRHRSYCADVVDGRIMGFGVTGYTLALRGAAQACADNPDLSGD